MQMAPKEFWSFRTELMINGKEKRGAKREKTELRKKNQTIFQSHLAVFVLY